MLEQPVRARLHADGRQVVDVVIDRGYHPATIVARAGVPLRLVFHRDDDDTCTERVVFSSPHLDRRLAASGSTTIDLPGQPPGEVRFTCGMGRYRGRIDLVAGRGPSIHLGLRELSSRFQATLGSALALARRLTTSQQGGRGATTARDLSEESHGSQSGRAGFASGLGDRGANDPG